MTAVNSCDHLVGVSLSDWHDRGFVYNSTLHAIAEAERAAAQRSVEINEEQGKNKKYKLFEVDIAVAIEYRDRMRAATDLEVLKENDFQLFCYCPNCGEKLSQGEPIVLKPLEKSV